jgi:hypothetical protein
LSRQDGSLLMSGGQYSARRNVSLSALRNIFALRRLVPPRPDRRQPTRRKLADTGKGPNHCRQRHSDPHRPPGGTVRWDRRHRRICPSCRRDREGPRRGCGGRLRQECLGIPRLGSRAVSTARKRVAWRPTYAIAPCPIRVRRRTGLLEPCGLLRLHRHSQSRRRRRRTGPSGARPASRSSDTSSRSHCTCTHRAWHAPWSEARRGP